jgi:hypothetical protein
VIEGMLGINARGLKILQSAAEFLSNFSAYFTQLHQLSVSSSHLSCPPQFGSQNFIPIVMSFCLFHLVILDEFAFLCKLYPAVVQFFSDFHFVPIDSDEELRFHNTMLVFEDFDAIAHQGKFVQAIGLSAFVVPNGFCIDVPQVEALFHAHLAAVNR